MRKSNFEKPKTCLASARVSTKKQTTGESLEDQVRVIKKFTEGKGWKILPDGDVDIEVCSGAKRRPVYENHIRYIKENPGKVGYYVIRYLDRFTRGGPSVYESMKKELSDLGVQLIDTNGIIQESRNMPELEELGFEYEWSRESPSEVTETVMATQASMERKKILTRTIPKQIEYTRQGYHIGRYDDGYIPERIFENGKMRYIQSPDPKRSHFIKKIFELRAECKLTDKEIVEYLNGKTGYLSPLRNKWNKERTQVIGKSGAKKLTIKQMHRILRRTTYAGVICEKWTHKLPVKAKYTGLVTIDLFNKANRGKVFLKENGNDIELIHDYKIKKKAYKRLRNNPEFPFKCIKCPICENPLKGSSSTGKSGKRFPSYHCARGHKRFSVSKDSLHNLIEDTLAKLNYSPEYINVLKKVLIMKFETRISEARKQKIDNQNKIRFLKEKQEQILEKYLLTENITTQKLLDNKIKEIEIEIQETEKKNQISTIKKEDISELIKYAEKIVEHPQKALRDKENPLRQQKLLSLVFDDFPTYEELASGTPKFSFVFNGFNRKSTTKSSTLSQLG